MKLPPGILPIDDLAVLAIHEEYESLMHALQTGVAAKMHVSPSETTPKSLRVGVNSALLEVTTIMSLLFEKNIITPLEYFTRLRDFVKAEVEHYEKYLSEQHGTTIKLL